MTQQQGLLLPLLLYFVLMYSEPCCHHGGRAKPATRSVQPPLLLGLVWRGRSPRTRRGVGVAREGYGAIISAAFAPEQVVDGALPQRLEDVLPLGMRAV